ncbi:unnamed protein product [Hermetia illucens]|uniref:C3H1-type domain-containing protein n=1 Tax=Hermetia illucens TaxID=343691 RepID=A0A7R8UWU6_HERIL|nr:endoribonuclease ZC3H12A isoform X2 [Hermetia illucens]CAD7088549.1 unnamed protein product [Hermetia illucens]
MLIKSYENDNKLHYIESLAIAEAEDSSYDSDCENDDTHNNSKNIDHEQVSRTTSDTLGQEFAEYVTKPQQPQNVPSTSPSPGSAQSSNLISERPFSYTARVEFALKLGYTERLVQAALARLGPDPAQNELLGELIKLGAQHSNKGDFCCDSPTAECLSPIGGSTASLVGGAGGDVAIHHPLAATCSFSDDPSQQVNRLRPIVIDGSNVAMSHGNKEVFSCRGIKLCVDWFKNRGHQDIVVFVPKWRKESSRPDNPIKDQEILNELERDRMLVFTPSRLVGGKRMVCYDDRYILKLAAANDGIVVSNDNYRDLVQESSEFKKVVEERVLMYSFVNDRFMPPDDPLGRSGPTLDNFLRIQPKKGDPPPPCPYGKKCTYGNKCKFHHPERGLGPHKSVTERLSEHAARHLSARNSSSESVRQPVQGKSLSVPLSGASDSNSTERSSRKALCRTRSGAPDCATAKPSALTQPTPQQQPQQSPIPAWDPSTCHPASDTNHINFPKSHSIENISREAYSTHPHLGLHPSYASLWSASGTQAPSTAPQAGASPVSSSATSKQLSANNSEPVDESINLHKKLRRQLTLNPAGCDPRIYQMQRCLAPTGGGGGAAAAAAVQPHSPHRPLAPSLSGPRTHHPPTQWDLHQSVTRIASAPDPSRPWHSGPPPASSSEPHINLWPHHAPPTVLAAQDQRRRLHYHLASIFPEEQVQTVMQMYPDETNPQTICAAILSMFPKI